MIQEKNLIGFQGRSLVPNSVKYITVMLNEEAPKIYGLDKSQKLKNPFTSSKDRSIPHSWKTRLLCAVPILIFGRFGWCNYIWVFDNEPRNREIVERISKTINRGDQIVIWPPNVQEKDVNDMILGGHDVMSMLQSNTYSGLKAKN